MTSQDSTKTKTYKNKQLAADSVTLPKQKRSNDHRSVMVPEVLELLEPQTGQSYLDLTAGYGGHAKAVLAKTKNMDRTLLIDRDSFAVRELRRLFPQVKIINKDYASVLKTLEPSLNSYDLVLADIGVASPHIDNPNRGFSFKHDGPLDMRMDQKQDLTASDIVNNYSLSDLNDIFKCFGQEKRSLAIAKAIIESRPVKTTFELSAIVSKTIGKQKGKDPATRTFQALRIAVNDELGQLKTMLAIAPKLLNSGGRLAIISFHSLEDAMVKQAFKELAPTTYDAEYKLITKKPIIPSKTELDINPRSRSAKLRVLQRK